MRSVVLTEAFAWVCNSCGAINYSHCVEQFLSEEEFELEFGSNSPGGQGVYLTKPPSIVVCNLCKESFETELEGIEEFEGDA